jgi:hypothetical protein
MKLIFDYKFRFYTSKMNEICLHCHLLYFFSIILSFGHCGYSLHERVLFFLHCSELRCIWVLVHWVALCTGMNWFLRSYSITSITKKIIIQAIFDLKSAFSSLKSKNNNLIKILLLTFVLFWQLKLGNFWCKLVLNMFFGLYPDALRYN